MSNQYELYEEEDEIHEDTEFSDSNQIDRFMSEPKEMPIKNHQNTHVGKINNLKQNIATAFNENASREGYTQDQIMQYLADQARSYHSDPALASAGPGAIKMLLQDDFMNNIGHVADIFEYEDFIERLSIGALMERKVTKITKARLRALIREELEKLPSYDHYEYGIDHVPEKTKGHKEIIGHT